MRVAGFWRRLLADLIDALLLGAVGWALQWSAPDWVASLGVLAPQLGLAIAFVYTTLLSTRWGQGRTVGKRCLGLQVRARGGEALPLWRAALRAVPLLLAFYLDAFELVLGALVPIEAESVLSRGLGVVWLVTLLGLTALTALHPAKRGLHDLLAGSVVIHHREAFDHAWLAAHDRLPKTRTFRALLVVMGVLLAGGIGGVLTEAFGATNESQLELRRARHTLRRDPALRVTGLRLIAQTAVRADKQVFGSTMLVVTAKPPHVAEPLRIDDPLVDALYKATRDALPPSLAPDLLSLHVVSGFHLGIAKRVTTTEIVMVYADGGARRRVSVSTKY